jgi:hypothetical protein
VAGENFRVRGFDRRTEISGGEAEVKMRELAFTNRRSGEIAAFGLRMNAG